ncbi:MAG: two-component regulator propeller domain-containing protein [Bacteroides sp.]|nr:two-component regulator propeller domain-containing protein [Bacteroides sp.]
MLVMFLLSLAHAGANSSIYSLRFKQLTTIDGLPSDEVQKVFQDREGFIWFATRYGICRYDGYRTRVFKSNLYTQGLLTNNNAYCLADDADGNLWIGTQEGLNRMDKRTSQVYHYKRPTLPNNVVSCLLVTRDNTVWVGTDSGLCRYVAEADTFQVYSLEKTGGVLPGAAIKALFEDADGDLWIGTWSSGLFRYSLSEGKFYAYPQMNERHSAHVIFQDSKGNMYVSGWDSGLSLLHYPKDMKRFSWTTYHHMADDEGSLSDEIVYDIKEDFRTQTIWIGTRSGLSIMNPAEPGRFLNYLPHQDSHSIPFDEVNSLLCDQSGNFWLASVGGGGVGITDTRLPLFKNYPMGQDNDVPASAVRSLFTDADGMLWIGISNYGLVRRNVRTGEETYCAHLPEFAGVNVGIQVVQTLQRRNGELWFGTYDGGIMIYKRGRPVRVLTTDDTPFLYSNCVSALFEDSRGNCWVGCRGGLGVSYADGRHYKFEEIRCEDGSKLDWYYPVSIVEDTDGSIWMATANCGIVHVQGNVCHPQTLTYRVYNVSNRQLMSNNVPCLYLDSQNRLWAGTESGGLYLYDRQTKTFESMNKRLELTADIINSIQEDVGGCLWLGTNVGLVRICDIDNDALSTQTYTTVDGLLDNFFFANASCRRGDELYFGCSKGYNSFFPARLKSETDTVSFYITGIRIFNQQLSMLPPCVRERITSVTPTFARRITLPHGYDNLTIEFAALTYKNPGLNRYAYRLLGFDNTWQYTDASIRSAYYNNLKSGTYKFQLCASNENGVWSSEMRTLEIVVLPPFWATWWAYLIYILVALGILALIYRTARNRMLLQNELRLRQMEQAKAEELNHAKLQFFTNITHELLTPLTIISASVDELKMQAPGYDELYGVLSTNIRRLIRLLQQILEFRKAETGNLKLRVSQGDLAAFVQNEAEAFRPLVKKQKIQLSVQCTPASVNGYFDSDKLDKILYNLLSNAAKYTLEGGYIQVTLTGTDGSAVELRVKDSGSGMSQEQQKDLFKRFYEGNYRKYNTIGTGIGLSLVKDLVKLHGGTICVESELGKGSEFIITLPITRSAFRPEQVDDGDALPANRTIVYADKEPEVTADAAFAVVPDVVPASAESPVSQAADGDEDTDSLHTLLLVEDNEELLQLMVRLLQSDYHVLTAINGRQAIDILDREEVDLIVSDLMMPEMNGIELCRHVKDKLETSHIPVILLTAKTQEESRAEAYEVGADAYLTKPFNLSVLHARIRNLLKHKERMAQDFKNQLVFEVKELDYTSVDEEFMQRAIDCVHRHLSDPEFDQQQFVDEMNTSKSTLYKKLKSLTGLNTSGFIRNVRLKSAARIIEEKEGGIRISELAYAVGFNDPKYFSVCFKKELGMLPKEYAERFSRD